MSDSPFINGQPVSPEVRVAQTQAAAVNAPEPGPAEKPMDTVAGYKQKSLLPRKSRPGGSTAAGRQQWRHSRPFYHGGGR